jgi:AcrR family transcriptional regulator
MPKKVDHDTRRADIAMAAFRVIGRKGVAGATIRDIARETGYSVGAIVHYIKSKDHILLAAEEYSTRVIRERMVHEENTNRGLEALRQVLYSGLPTNDEMIGYWKIWFGFWELSKLSERIKTILRGRYDEAALRYGRLIRGAQETGEISPAISAEDAAISVNCQMDGIGVHVVMSGRPMSAEKQRQHIDLWIDSVLVRGATLGVPGIESPAFIPVRR